MPEQKHVFAVVHFPYGELEHEDRDDFDDRLKAALDSAIAEFDGVTTSILMDEHGIAEWIAEALTSGLQAGVMP